MKLTEKILVILFVFAIVLRFLQIPGGGALTLFSLIPFALLYCCFGFALFNNIRLRKIFKKESYLGISPKRMIGTIGLGFSLSEIILGICYKLQRWLSVNPNLYLTIGLFFTLVILIVALVAYSKNKTGFYKGIFIRIIIVGVLGLITLLSPSDYLNRVLPPSQPLDTEQGDN